MSKEMILSIVLVVILTMVSIGIHSKLVTARNATTDAFGPIDVQLKRRHELILDWIEISKTYLANEAVLLEKVIQARNHAAQAAIPACANPADAKAMAALSSAEASLGAAWGQWMVVSEHHPDLKADATMGCLSEQLQSTERGIAFARQHYNDVVLNYVVFARQFPTILVALMTGLHTLPRLQARQSHEEKQPSLVTS